MSGRHGDGARGEGEGTSSSSSSSPLSSSSSSSSSPPSILIVAHSMGGFIARAALTFPSVSPSSVSSLITLSTPHCAPPILAVDSSLASFYDRVNRVWQIAGRERDLLLQRAAAMERAMIEVRKEFDNSTALIEFELDEDVSVRPAVGDEGNAYNAMLMAAQEASVPFIERIRRYSSSSLMVQVGKDEGGGTQGDDGEHTDLVDDGEEEEEEEEEEEGKQNDVRREEDEMTSSSSSSSFSSSPVSTIWKLAADVVVASVGGGRRDALVPLDTTSVNCFGAWDRSFAVAINDIPEVQRAGKKVESDRKSREMKKENGKGGGRGKGPTSRGEKDFRSNLVMMGDRGDRVDMSTDHLSILWCAPVMTAVADAIYTTVTPHLSSSLGGKEKEGKGKGEGGDGKSQFRFSADALTRMRHMKEVLMGSKASNSVWQGVDSTFVSSLWERTDLYLWGTRACSSSSSSSSSASSSSSSSSSPVFQELQSAALPPLTVAASFLQHWGPSLFPWLITLVLYGMAEQCAWARRNAFDSAFLPPLHSALAATTVIARIEHTWRNYIYLRYAIIYSSF